MRATSTKIVSFDFLRQRGDEASIVVRLMMVANDLALANQASSFFLDDEPSISKHRNWGAKIYFLRLQLSHLWEGMRIIEEIHEHPSLTAFVRRCDEETQRAFDSLLRYIPNGTKHKEFEQLVGRIRNKLTFHYDRKSRKLVLRSIDDLSRPSKRRCAPITRGSESSLWRFEVADAVTDNIICRQFWKIPDDADLRDEANRVAGYSFQIFQDFLSFSGEFIWRYCKI